AGPPIHKSATSVVIFADDIKAIDDYRKTFQKITEGLEDAVLYKGEQFLKSMNDLGIGFDQVIADDKFDQFDVNGDGKMDEDEFCKFCRSSLDRDMERRVVIKFMVEREQWEREIKSRNEFKLESKYIVDVLRIYSTEPEEDQKNPLMQHMPITKEMADKFSFALTHEASEFKAYSNAIVMLGADRNLDTIFRSERPALHTIRALMSDVGDALRHLHENNLIHGDLKMMNVVRVNDKLRLIDFDAAVRITKRDADPMKGGTIHYVGAKFSSGILPPEMIGRINDVESGFGPDGKSKHVLHQDMKNYKKYFTENRDGEENHSVLAQLWDKVKPKHSMKHGFYAVKSFRPEKTHKRDERVKDERKLAAEIRRKAGLDEVAVEAEEPESLAVPWKQELLPYELIRSSPQYDMWSFGVMLYFMCTGHQLFKSDRDDDLTTVDGLIHLAGWSDDALEEKLKDVDDEAAKEVLKALLKPNVEDRPKDMKEVMDYEFFKARLDQDGSVKDILKRFD
ncbi:hypothetical protein TrST_g7336, partial [Triparma strigata]